ncbi:MAG TPA: amino acid adenylation domain-containing protein [Pseudonocardiaceae bacterium]|nr:amino acid adenylation domain-containing protein [Pseudonocardiaceae bacterium]
MTATEQGTPVRVAVPRTQHLLWLADQLTPDDAVYLSSNFLRLRGPLDVDALHSALVAVVTRHEVLRTSMVLRDGEVVGLVRPPTDLRFAVEDVDPDGLDAAMRAVASAPLDITAEPPLRARLLRLGAHDHVLCLTAHHIAVDRTSVRVLFRELASHYNSAGDGLAPVDQFRDIAGADDVLHDSGALAGALAERVTALADRTPFELPSDRPRPASRAGSGFRRHAFDLPAETVRELGRIGRRQAATLFMVLRAGCEALLYRYTGRADVTTGTSASTRHGSGGDDVIGPFLTMLVLPGDVSGNPTFTDLVGRVRDAALDAFDGRLIPFDTLVTELGVERDASRTPLFQILVDFAMPVDPPTLRGLTVAILPTPGGGAKYDLSIDFHQVDDRVGVFVEWDTALYDDDTVTRLMDHLRVILVAAARQPDLRVDDLPMLSAADLAELRAFAEPEPAPVPDACLHELFTRQAARTPDAVAVQDDVETLTYAELDRRSDAVADGLAGLGVGPDVPVGVLLDRSAELVVALLGVLKAGGAYVPLDPEAPAHRWADVLTASRAPVCVVPAPGDVTDVDPDVVRKTVTRCGGRAVEVAALASPGEPRSRAVRPDHLCAVYFTSGSTGTPKGVASTHRGWVSHMHDMQRRYRLRAGDPVLLKTPLSFDDVAREVFWPLMVGGRIVVLPPGLHRDPRALIRAVDEHRLPWLQFVPSMLALFLEEVGAGQATSLRHVVSDGDRLRPELVRLFTDRLGTGCQLNNQWGTTEVSIDSTHHVCVPADGDVPDAVVLGTPMESHEVYVLDDSMRPMPRGAVGELCIGGVGLARGYLGEPGRTARRFVPHPWRAGERLYRTGDSGRVLADGSLEYRGRRDHQVKVRGVRIELGEVEAVVRACPGVADAVAATWEAVPGDKRLAAYAAVPGGGPNRLALRDFLADRLPPAAVPSALVVLPDLPRMPSGKVNRRALPRPDTGDAGDEPFVAPSTDAESAVAEIWAAVLGSSRLGANDNFFAAGGHSLLVTRAVNRMRDAFAVDVPLRLVFEHPTVSSAAARVEELILDEIESMADADVSRLLDGR